MLCRLGRQGGQLRFQIGQRFASAFDELAQHGKLRCGLVAVRRIECPAQPRQRIEAARGHPITLEIEPGRYLVAEAGVLLSEVRAVKRQGRQHFVLVDAGFNDLMRPSMYGAHHGIQLLPADDSPRASVPTVVGGPLCESGDVFTQGDGGVVLTRDLPAARVGDLLVFEDAGAYGASMSSNYNSRPLIPEVLVDGGQARLIRRRQTMGELLALETLV